MSSGPLVAAGSVPSYAGLTRKEHPGAADRTVCIASLAAVDRLGSFNAAGPSGNNVTPIDVRAFTQLNWECREHGDRLSG